MGRAVIAAIWVSALGMVAVAVFALYELRRSPAPTPKAMSIEVMPTRQPHRTLARWTVTERFTAHNIVVAHVETEYLNESMSIARQLIEPLDSKYAEVLIYFHRPGRPDTLPPRRIQWTPQGGYVESVY